MPAVLDWLEALPEPALLAAIALLIVGESIVGLGFFIPGEAALLVASTTIGSVPEFLLMWTVITISAVAGNLIAFALGRHLGSALRDTKLVRKHGGEGWDKATRMLEKHGPWAVFVGRVIPLVRSFVPAVAGAGGMSYRAFLLPVTAGAAIATALPVLFGIAVREGIEGSGTVGLVVGGLLLVLVIGFVVVKRRRRAAAAVGAGGDARRDPGQDPELEPAR